MATGLSKTNINSEIEYSNIAGKTSADVVLSFAGKKPVDSVLAVVPSTIELLWKGSGQLNRLLYGDNLGLLAYLAQCKELHGMVKLIYIDPPYSTKSVFQSRSQDHAYTDLLGGAHYLEFLRERLILLRELLSEDGSIYVHLDDNMAFHVKVLMDEIFGSSNFRNWITRKKCNPKNYTRKQFGNVADYILFYSKTKDYVWNRPVDEWTEDWANREYPYLEDITGRRYKKVPIHAPGERNGETGKVWRGMTPPPGKHWQYTPKRLEEMDSKGEIYWSPNGNPRRKVYLDESNGVPAQDIWLDFRDAHNQNVEITGYPTEKNSSLIERIIKASSNPGDLVLDCFAGSGTTLEVASRLERHWIGMDNSAHAIATILKRFAHGTERMGDFVGKRSKPNGRPQTFNLFRVMDFELLSVVSKKHEIDEWVLKWQTWLQDEVHVSLISEAQGT